MPGRRRELWPKDDWAVAQAQQRQLLQLGFVDVVIGRVIARLKAAGMYDRSLMIVLSDHGVAFRSGSPRRDFTDETAAQIMRIPLILKLPVDSPAIVDGTFTLGKLKVNDRNVETIDLVPTIADILGVAVPWKTDGTSVVGVGAKEPATKSIFYDMARQETRLRPARPGPSGRRFKSSWTRLDGSPIRIGFRRPPRFASLIGLQTSRLQIADGGCAVAVDYLSDFSQMDRDGAVVPFEFAGQFEGELPADGLSFLAVSINGTVRAVTRSWRAAPREWLATPGARCLAQRHECRGSVQDRGVVGRDVAAPVCGSRGPFTLSADATDRAV